MKTGINDIYEISRKVKHSFYIFSADQNLQWYRTPSLCSESSVFSNIPRNLQFSLLNFRSTVYENPFYYFFFLQMFIVGQTFDSWSSDINVQSMLGSFYLSSIHLEYTLLTITKEIRLT